MSTRFAIPPGLVVSWLFLVAAFARAQQPSKPLPLPPISPGQARLEYTIGGLDAPGTALAYSERTGILAAGCEAGLIRYWTQGVLQGVRVGDGTPNVIQGHAGPVMALVGGGAMLASAGPDSQIRMWNLPEGKPARSIQSPFPPRSLAMSSDGKLLAFGGEATSVQLLDVTANRPPLMLGGHQDWVLALAFNPAGTRLASGGYDKLVRLWEVPTGKKLLEFSPRPAPPANSLAVPESVVLSLAFSPDGKQLAVGSSEGQIHLINTADGKILRALQGHEGAVTSLAYHPGGALLVSASKDRTLRLWDPNNGQPIKTLEGHTAWVLGVAFLTQGTRLASVGADQTVRIWNLAR